MSKFKLTKAGRAVVGVVLAVAVAVGVVGGIKGGVIKFDKRNRPPQSRALLSVQISRLIPLGTTRSICLWMSGRAG